MSNIKNMKEKGNEAYVAGKYEEAIGYYTEGYTCGISESADKDVLATLLSNRAACYLKLGGDALQKAISDCEELLKVVPTHEKGLFRLAQAYEKYSIVKKSKNENCLDELVSSFNAYTRLITFSTENKIKFEPYVRRARELLEKEQKKSVDIRPAIEKLNSTEDITDWKNELKVVMGHFERNKYNKKQSFDSKLPEILFRKLSSLIQNDNNYDNSNDNNDILFRALCSVMKVLNSNITVSLTPFSIYSDSVSSVLLSITEEIKFKENNNKNNKNTSPYLVKFLALLSINPRFESFKKRVVECFVGLLRLLEKQQNKENNKQNNDADDELCKSLLNGITLISKSGYDGITLTRDIAFYDILFSKLWNVRSLHSAIVTCISSITNYEIKDEPSTFNNNPQPQQQQPNEEKITESERKFTNTYVDIITLMITDNTTQSYMKACQGLSIILQANPPFGVAIVTKSDNKDEQQTTRIVSEMNNDNEKEEKENSQSLPKVLEQLLLKCCDSDPIIAILSVEVLALSSSNTLVRECLSKAGLENLLLDLVENEFDTSLTVQCHAGLALSKLVAMSNDTENILTDKQHDDFVKAIIRILKTQEKEAKNDNNDDIKNIQRGSENLRGAIEALSYLCLHVRTKKLLVSYNHGNLLEYLFTLVNNTNDHAIRYGLTQIFKNINTSSDDIKTDYNEEIEQLRKVAQKGLANVGDNNDMVRTVAGTSKEISIIKKLFVDYGGVTAISSLIKQFCATNQRVQEIHTELKSNNKEPSNNDQLSKFKQNGMSNIIAESLSETLLYLSTSNDKSNPNNKDIARIRGMMVQQGVLASLTTLSLLPSIKCKDNSALALSKILITTNPVSLPKSSSLTSLYPILLRLIKDSDHEYPQFEGLLALTNLASMGVDASNSMIDHGAWSVLRNTLSVENTLIQRATIECMCNLVNSDKTRRILMSESGDQDLKFFLIFAQMDEDVQTQMAATGCLAMLSYDKEIMKKILNVEYSSIVHINNDDDDEEKEEGKKVQVVRSGWTIIRYLKQIESKSSPTVQDINMPDGVKMRVKVIWDNMKEHKLIPKDECDLSQIYAPWLSVNEI